MCPMTRNQYDHHAEQMEAYRADFQKHWSPIKDAIIAITPSRTRDLTMLELREWNRWYAEKKLGVR